MTAIVAYQALGRVQSWGQSALATSSQWAGKTVTVVSSATSSLHVPGPMVSAAGAARSAVYGTASGVQAGVVILAAVASKVYLAALPILTNPVILAVGGAIALGGAVFVCLKMAQLSRDLEKSRKIEEESQEKLSKAQADLDQLRKDLAASQEKAKKFEALEKEQKQITSLRDQLEQAETKVSSLEEDLKAAADSQAGLRLRNAVNLLSLAIDKERNREKVGKPMVPGESPE